MALSLLSHPTYTELQTVFDPIRINFDFNADEPMEFSPIINQQNTSNQRNYTGGTQIQSNTQTNNFHDYEQVINFVDSPPNSKESWPGDYPKGDTNNSAVTDIQTLYNLNSNRKRRMDWESLDIQPNADSPPASNSKIPNIGTKDKEKKKGAGRGSWTDDIDFDLNSEFGNNGYLNNETFLSLSSALTVLKQEITSPSNDAQKRCKSPSKTSITTKRNEDREKDLLVKNNNNSNDDNLTTAGGAVVHHQQQQQQQHHQQQQQQSQQSDPNQQNSHSSSVDHQNVHRSTLGNFQHIIQQQQQQQNNLDNNSAKNSPNHNEIGKPDTVQDDYKFQYILAAATSIATKNNEETLTYLNQGQSYEIKLKKIGDLSFYRGKILKSVIKICFHERRLQYMEREQMQQWQQSRPGERIIEVDVPLSYGLCHMSQPLNLLNTVEILWDPMKEVGVYIKVNCISTEFTPKKHGGEKGVPFRIQIETYLENSTNNSDNTINGNNKPPIHAAACQIKVFKLKGADRKHKQDREKIQRRPPSEQEKYQPSYECTILNDIPIDSLSSSSSASSSSAATAAGCYSPEYIKPTVSPLLPNSPVHIPKYDGVLPFTSNPSPIAINSVTSTNANNFKLMEQNMVSPQQVDMEDYSPNLVKESTPTQVSQWLTHHRLNSYVATFAHFSGSDVLRMSKEDLIQICGLADGIRMFNTLHAKAITPRLTIYVSLDGNSYHAIFLIANTVKELTQKLFKLPGFYELCTSNPNMNGVDGNVYSGWGLQSKYSGSGSNLYDASKIALYINGPSGIHVLVTDEVLNNIKDDSLFTLEVQNGNVLMKAVYKSENN